MKFLSLLILFPLLAIPLDAKEDKRNVPLSSFIEDTMKVHAVEIFYDPKMLLDRDREPIRINRQVRLLQTLPERLRFIEAMVDGEILRLDQRHLVLRVNRRDEIAFRNEARQLRKRMAEQEKQIAALQASLAEQARTLQQILTEVRTRRNQ